LSVNLKKLGSLGNFVDGLPGLITDL